jgi:hypothetical protein
MLHIDTRKKPNYLTADVKLNLGKRKGTFPADSNPCSQMHPKTNICEAERVMKYLRRVLEKPRDRGVV